MDDKFHICTEETATRIKVAAADFIRVLANQFKLGDAFLKSSKDFIS